LDQNLSKFLVKFAFQKRYLRELLTNPGTYAAYLAIDNITTLW